MWMLGTAQTLAWASSYYLPAVLANSIATELGISVASVFGAFSLALLVAALVGPLAGRLIDHHGGRLVLISSNLLFATGLVALSLSSGVISLFLAWAWLGLAMGSGLYEAAFATIVRLKGSEARKAITGITLLAGFASTVGWPLSSFLDVEVGWRLTCVTWAGLHLLLGLPLNAGLPKAPRVTLAHASSNTAVAAAPSEGGMTLTHRQRQEASYTMAYVFAVAWILSTSMAAHLPNLLHISGITLAAAVLIASLVGPAQVTGRLLELCFLSRLHPLLSARFAVLAHPLGAMALVLFGASGAVPFAVLHGIGNGILTIAIGTLPLVVFGPQGYGQRQGLLMVPARLMQAASPFLFGLAVEQWGVGALGLSAALSLTALMALRLMPENDRKDR